MGELYRSRKMSYEVTYFLTKITSITNASASCCGSKDTHASNGGPFEEFIPLLSSEKENTVSKPRSNPTYFGVPAAVTSCRDVIFGKTLRTDLKPKIAFVAYFGGNNRS